MLGQGSLYEQTRGEWGEKNGEDDGIGDGGRMDGPFQTEINSSGARIVCGLSVCGTRVSNLMQGLVGDSVHYSVLAKHAAHARRKVFKELCGSYKIFYEGFNI